MKRKKPVRDKRVTPVHRKTPDLSLDEFLNDQTGQKSFDGIVEPTEESVTRLTAIPLLFDEPRGIRPKAGSLVYDSWSEGPKLALRDRPDGHIRRLQLRGGELSLEIVAERTRGHWDFVGRVYRGSTVIHGCVLTVGRKKLLSESGGFFRWSSRSVPRKIGLTSFSQSYTFERLSW